MSASLLDPVTTVDTAEAPRQAAAGDPGEDTAGNANQYVTFCIADEMFAVALAPVQEIIRMPAVAHLPLAPGALEGLANLRGRVLPIVNLRRLLGCAERPHDDATRALVIHIGQALAFVVDRVASVISVDPAQIESTDALQSVVSADFLKGVIKRPSADGGVEMLLLIDFERVIEGQLSTNGKGRARTAGRTAAVTRNAPQEAGAAVSEEELRLVSFSVAAQEYALDIAQVQEIVQLPEHITALPNAPAHVLGLIALRNRLLPMVSLRSLFGLPRVEYAEQQRIVVTLLPGGMNVGLVTDAVKEVLSVPRSQAEPMPGILAADDGLQEITSVCRLEEGKRLVSIIATDRLLRMPAIAQAIAAAQSNAQSTARSVTQSTVQSAALPAAPSAPIATNAGETDTMPTGTLQADTLHADDIDTDDDLQVVIFRLGAEEFGVPITSVQEIVRVPESLTRVPRTPAFVEGVINLRGTVLPVIDQRARLGLPLLQRRDGQRIMVYLLGGTRTGFIVDSVAEVLRIPQSDIAPAPELSGEQNPLISRIANLQGAKRLVMLIDPQHLLQGRELQAVQRMKSAGDPGSVPPIAATDAAAPQALARAA
jgi:purine-binding chemotaxis protein CheW